VTVPALLNIVARVLNPVTSARRSALTYEAERAATSLSILMPVFNERSTIRTAIEQVLQAPLGVGSLELVIVDDGSTDGTREILRVTEWPPQVRVVFHERNGGKGAAVRTALGHATGDFAAIMDADLEYDPAEIADLLPPLLSGEADAVYGARGFASHASFNFWYVIGNKLVTLAANVIYNAYLADIMTCHKVIPTATFRSLDLRQSGFGIEPEITARLLRGGLRIYEVPIAYRARRRDEGKKLTAVDGLRVVATLLRCRFDRR
jgi:glycosyltransferase involved in cell wall biosynthesis